MYLRDITYVYDGNSDYLDEEKTLINLEKLTLASAILSDIQKFQSVPYDMYSHSPSYVPVGDNALPH